MFFPGSDDTYNLSENRNFNTYGVKVDYTVRPRDGLEFKVGTMSSITNGHEDFQTVDGERSRPARRRTPT